MNRYRNPQNVPLETLEQNIFGANKLNYIVLKTNKGGLLRTLDIGEYVSRYPGRIYRLDSDNELNVPLLFLSEDSDYKQLVETAEKYREAVLKSAKKPECDDTVKDGFVFRFIKEISKIIQRRKSDEHKH